MVGWWNVRHGWLTLTMQVRVLLRQLILRIAQSPNQIRLEHQTDYLEDAGSSPVTQTNLLTFKTINMKKIRFEIIMTITNEHADELLNITSDKFIASVLDENESCESYIIEDLTETEDVDKNKE